MEQTNKVARVEEPIAATGPNYFDNVPDVVITEIFSYLPLNESQHAREVCKRFRTVLSAPEEFLSRHIVAYTSRRLILMPKYVLAGLKKLTVNCGVIAPGDNSRNIKEFFLMGDSMVTKILPGSSKTLRYLHLDNTSSYFWSCIIVWLESTKSKPALEVLKVDYALFDSYVKHSFIPQVKKLPMLRYGTRLSVKDFMLRYMDPDWKNPVLNTIQLLLDEFPGDLATKLVKFFPNIECVMFEMAGIIDRDTIRRRCLECVTKIPKLRRLTLKNSFATEFYDPGPNCVLKEMPIKDLSIALYSHNNRHYEPMRFFYFPVEIIGDAITHVEVGVGCTAMFYMDDTSFKFLPNLEKFALTASPKEEHQDFDDIYPNKYCKKLKYLSLRYVDLWTISNMLQNAFFASFPLLEYLYLDILPITYNIIVPAFSHIELPLKELYVMGSVSFAPLGNLVNLDCLSCSFNDVLRANIERPGVLPKLCYLEVSTQKDPAQSKIVTDYVQTLVKTKPYLWIEFCYLLNKEPKEEEEEKEEEN